MEETWLAGRRGVMLSPGASRGWGWVQLSTIASVVVLGVSAATAAVALWMKLADKQHHLLVMLSIWSAMLGGLGFLAAAVGKVADLRATALKGDVRIIPILLSRAVRLNEAELPADVAPLAHLQYLRFEHRNVEDDFSRLVNALQARRRDSI